MNAWHDLNTVLGDVGFGSILEKYRTTVTVAHRTFVLRISGWWWTCADGHRRTGFHIVVPWHCPWVLDGDWDNWRRLHECRSPDPVEVGGGVGVEDSGGTSDDGADTVTLDNMTSSSSCWSRWTFVGTSPKRRRLHPSILTWKLRDTLFLWKSWHKLTWSSVCMCKS